MGQQDVLSSPLSGVLTPLVAGAGFAGSVAAISLPSSMQTSEIAAVLAFGALALLAGHRWGLLVVVAADVMLLGRVWPLLIREWPSTPATQLAVYTALLGALPGLLLLRSTLPQMVDFLLGRQSSPRPRVVALALATCFSLGWLILPAL